MHFKYPVSTSSIMVQSGKPWFDHKLQSIQCPHLCNWFTPADVSCPNLSLLQGARHPAVEEVERSLGLVIRRHVASLEDLEEGQIARRLESTVLLGTLAGADLDRAELSLGEVLVARPLELVGPSLVAEPVADEVGVTSIDEDRNLLQDLRHKSEIRLHPVALEQEVAVNVKVAAVISVDLGAEGLHDVGLVQPLGDVLELVIAEAASLALLAHVVRVLASALVGANNGVVAVNAGRNAGPGTLRVVARLDQGLAAGEGVVQTAA